jgi:hypothetical protein
MSSDYQKLLGAGFACPASSFSLLERRKVRSALRGSTRKPPRSLRSSLGWEALFFTELLGPLGPPSSACPGPWVSMATAGAGPGDPQPEWGRVALGASAAASPCSPLWRQCSLSRCPPRCRGETRVKYSKGAPPVTSLSWYGKGRVPSRPGSA